MVIPAFSDPLVCYVMADQLSARTCETDTPGDVYEAASDLAIACFMALSWDDQCIAKRLPNAVGLRFFDLVRPA